MSLRKQTNKLQQPKQSLVGLMLRFKKSKESLRPRLSLLGKLSQKLNRRIMKEKKSRIGQNST